MTATFGVGTPGNQISATTGDDIFTVCIVNGDVGTPTITDDQGGTYNPVCSNLFGTSTCKAWLFVRSAFAPTTTTYTLTGNPFPTANNYKQYTFTYVGMLQAGLAGIRSTGTQGNQALGGTPAPTLNQAALTTNPTITIVGNQRNSAGMTAPTGWTQRIDDGTQNVGDTFETGIDVETRDSGFSGTTVTWGSVSLQPWASLFVELDSSSGSPPVVPDWPPAAPSLGLTRTTTTGGDVIRADDIGPDKVQLMKVRAGPPSVENQGPMVVSGDRVIRYYEELRDYAENRRDAFQAWLDSLGGARSRATPSPLFPAPFQVAAVDPTTQNLAGFWRDITAANQAGVASAGTSGSQTFGTLGVDPTFNTTSLSGHPTALFGAGKSLALSGTFADYATASRFVGWMVVKISSITNNPCPISDNAVGVTYQMSTGTLNGPPDVESFPLNGDSTGAVARSLVGYLGQFCIVTWNYDATNNQIGINEIPGLAGDGVGTKPTSKAYGNALSPLTNSLMMGDANGTGAALGEVAELGIWGTAPTPDMWKGTFAYIAQQYGGGLAVPL